MRPPLLAHHHNDLRTRCRGTVGSATPSQAWHHRLPPAWREMVVAPLAFEVFRDADLAAERCFGYDTERRRCYYAHRFRIDTPRIQPLRCKLVKHHEGKESEVFDFPLLDISGGGLCMSGPVETADHFSLGELFTDCRLEIPDESVISVNLRVREVSRLETANGQIQLRLGCEYVNLPSARQNLIERYITRLERSRKAQADLI